MSIDIKDDDLSSIFGEVPVIHDGDFGMIGGDEHRRLASIHQLSQINQLLEKYEETRKVSGMNKWFVPGSPYSIDHCPKHKAFFAAGADYDQRLFMAANR